MSNTNQGTPRAYTVSDATGVCEYSAVVYASSPAEARMMATSYELMEGCEYIDLRAKRFPDADDLLHTGNYLDWAEHSEWLIERGWREVE